MKRRKLSDSFTLSSNWNFLSCFLPSILRLLHLSAILHSSASLVFDGISEYQAIDGDTVSLPCNISAGWNEAHITLLVWYRSGNQGNPIYSIDSRNSLTTSRHQVTAELSGRVRMDLNTRPPVLHIDSVREADAGDYRCRVDYRVNRTQQFLIHLNVSVPPKEVVIRDLIGNVVQGMTGIPYNEGDKVALFCDAIGGHPPPVVVWRANDGQIVDSSYEILVSNPNVTRNSLVYAQIDRSHLLQELTCEAYPPPSLGNQSEVLQQPPPRNAHIRRSSVVLDMNLKPLVVQIQVPNFQHNLNRSLTGTALSPPPPPTTASSSFARRVLVVSAGRKTEIECRTWGSRPPAEITWWRGSRRLPTAASRSQYTSAPSTITEASSSANEANLTISILGYTATPEDDGQRLTCRVDNLLLTNEEIEDSVIISVRYAPQLSLSLGAKIPDTIRESSDVYFECTVKANPAQSEVVWLFEGRPLANDPVSGVLLTNQSLVMQRVRREHRGFYQCIASNAEGISASNKVFLNVHFAPVCKPGQTIIFGVARTEHILIPCEVEAEPVTPITFRWFFNNTFESFELPKSDYSVELLKVPQPSIIGGGLDQNRARFASLSYHFNHLSLEAVLNSIASHNTVANSGPSIARSNATYTPRTRIGYGTLYCLAENSIGTQRDPCTFSIVEAGPPNSAHDCRIVNVTMTSFVLECVAGENGGLRQIFHLEVYNIEKEHLQVNVTSLDAPVFTVENLPHDTAFTLNVFSSNAKGRSDSVTLRTATTAYAEKHTTNGKKHGVLLFDDVNDLLLSPMFGAMVGVFISLLLLCAAIIVFVRQRVCSSRRQINTTKDAAINSNGANTTLTTNISGGGGGEGTEQLKDVYGMPANPGTSSAVMNEFMMRAQFGPQLNTANYYRFQPSAAGTLPLLQHSHGLIAAAAANSSTPTSDSLTLTEMSIVNSHLEPNFYPVNSCGNGGHHYPPEVATTTATTLLHSTQPSSDLMTNAFTYSVNTGSRMYHHHHPAVATGDFVTLNSSPRTYTEISAPADRVTLGPMVNCIDSLSSSTSDKTTTEVDDDWRHGSKHPRVSAQVPYIPYTVSNEQYISNNVVSLSTPPPPPSS